jgi:deoxycytidylate deaminase
MVIRVNGSGELCDSKPCAICKDMMVKSGIKAVYYSNDKGAIVKLNLKEECDHVSQGFIKMSRSYPSYVLRLPVEKKTIKMIISKFSSIPT